VHLERRAQDSNLHGVAPSGFQVQPHGEHRTRRLRPCATCWFRSGASPSRAEVARLLEAGRLSHWEQEALSRAFVRTIQTSELLVAYALCVAGKPSRQWAA